MYQSAGRHQTGKVFENSLWENVFEKPAQVLFDGMNNYTDHLDERIQSTALNEVCERSSVRLSYSLDPQTQQLKVLDETEERGSRTPKKRRSHKTNNSEQNHYYPFGLKHSVYTPNTMKDFTIDDTPGGPGTPVLI